MSERGATGELTPPPVSAPVANSDDGKVDTEGVAPTVPLQSAGERFSTVDDSEEPLSVVILDETQMRAGESITLRLEVSKHGEGEIRPAARANITVKILGSSFQPSSTYSTADSYGHSSISVTLPNFKTGRGAVLIRAERDGDVAEVRRIIHPA
jgi:hypothetical protein